MPTSKSGSLYEEAKRLIPGASLFSKRPEVNLPDGWPIYYTKARGIEVTSLDGTTYLDFCGAGVGAAVLGWADPDVDGAVIEAVRSGSTSPLMAPEEVELARLLTFLHPWAGACRFTRSGGEAMAVAIRIAQAATGRLNVHHKDSYHGWHVNDPRDGTRFLPRESGSLAAIIVEPSRLSDPKPGELERWRELADANGAVLIFDEISSGFRRNLGGSHLLFGVNPDIAVFSKALGNGYPIGAVVGRPEIMTAAENTFISSTAWSERIGPAAACRTLQKMWAEDVFEHTANIGQWVRGSIEYAARRFNIEVIITGPPQMLHIQFSSPVVQTLYTELMLERGILAGRDFYSTFAHTLDHCEQFAYAVNQVFPLLSDESLLRSQPVETGVRRCG